jgi:hypothetical protein
MEYAALKAESLLGTAVNALPPYENPQISITHCLLTRIGRDYWLRP